MRRSFVRVLTVALASIAFAACKNGSNNGYDTNGIGAGSAAGQVPPSGIDTSHRDTTHRSKRP
jgi:hypothetical protein